MVIFMNIKWEWCAGDGCKQITDVCFVHLISYGGCDGGGSFISYGGCDGGGSFLLLLI